MAQSITLYVKLTQLEMISLYCSDIITRTQRFFSTSPLYYTSSWLGRDTFSQPAWPVHTDNITLPFYLSAFAESKVTLIKMLHQRVINAMKGRELKCPLLNTPFILSEQLNLAEGLVL